MRMVDHHAFAPAQRQRCEQFGLAQCVDIHCHCLPGLDDGPASWDAAVELCRAAVADGITTAIATPHQLGSYDRRNSAEVVRDAVRQMNARLDDHQISLDVVPGGDVRIDERLLQLLDADEVATVADAGRHILLELPRELFVDPLRLIQDLSGRGIQVILTHPERYAYLHGSTAPLRAWIASGAVFQITAGSLLGDFGPTALHAAWRLVGEGWASLVATDAHDTLRRPPRLTPAIELLDQELGAEATRHLCAENPLRVLRGEHLPRPVPG